jgi:hypothetical protein
MAKNHGARQQKRVAKQKAKRSAKRSTLMRLSSLDPTIRLHGVDKLPVVRSLVGSRLWDAGIGHLTIARQESTGGIIAAVFLVDVFCLGVKDAFWRAGTHADFENLIEQMEKAQKMSAITPECLVKIVKGAVEFAHSFGFPPHPGYRHASILLDGIDPSSCPNQFEYGREGRPFYIQGPNEPPELAMAIGQRAKQVGGHYFVEVPGEDVSGFSTIERASELLDSADQDDSPDESL